MFHQLSHTSKIKQIVGPDRNISEGHIVMLGYRLVIGIFDAFARSINFGMHQVSFICAVFKRYGILNWISNIGGWAVLAARRLGPTMVCGIFTTTIGFVGNLFCTNII